MAEAEKRVLCFAEHIRGSIAHFYMFLFCVQNGCNLSNNTLLCHTPSCRRADHIISHRFACADLCCMHIG